MVFVISVLVASLLSSSSFVSSVFAASKDPRWENGGCSLKDYEPGSPTSTCCWREMVPGQILGQEYCQTCDSSTGKCGDKELQMDYSQIPDSVRPPSNGGGVLEQPPTGEVTQPPTTGESVFPGEGGVLEQPPTSTNDNNENTPSMDGITEDVQTSNDGQIPTLNSNENIPSNEGGVAEEP